MRTEDKLALNLREAAKVLSLSVPTLYSLLASGEISGRRVGRRWVISVDSMRNWLSGEGEEADAR